MHTNRGDQIIVIRHSIYRVVTTAVLMLFALPNYASQYSPEGLYNPEVFTLDNGLRVILKRRTVSHNVATFLGAFVIYRDIAIFRS